MTSDPFLDEPEHRCGCRGIVIGALLGAAVWLAAVVLLVSLRAGML